MKQQVAGTHEAEGGCGARSSAAASERRGDALREEGEIERVGTQDWSMKIAASNPVVNFNIVEDLFGDRRLNHQACSPTMMKSVHGLHDPSCVQMSVMHQTQPLPAVGFGLDIVVRNHYTQEQSAAVTPVSMSSDESVQVNGAVAWNIGSQNLFNGFDA